MASHRRNQPIADAAGMSMAGLFAVGLTASGKHLYRPSQYKSPALDKTRAPAPTRTHHRRGQRTK
jgi:hypothetical protein